MDDLISTIVYLIPVAAVIFLRAFAVKRKADAAKARREGPAASRIPPERPAAADRRAAVRMNRAPEVGLEEWKPHWVEEEYEAEEEAPGAAETQPALTPGAFYDTATPVPETDSGSRVEAVGSQDFPLSGSGPSLLSGADMMRETTSAAAAEKAKHPFPESVEGLPPLRKAVVLSEILGRPRALGDGES